MVQEHVVVATHRSNNGQGRDTPNWHVTWVAITRSGGVFLVHEFNQKMSSGRDMVCERYTCKKLEKDRTKHPNAAAHTATHWDRTNTQRQIPLDGPNIAASKSARGLASGCLALGVAATITD